MKSFLSIALLFKPFRNRLKNTAALPVALFLFLMFSGPVVHAQKKTISPKQKSEYMVLRVYHTGSADGLSAIEQYLQATLLPQLDKAGFRRNGVFTLIGNDTAADKRLYVLTPFAELSQLEKLSAIGEKSLTDSINSGGYTNAKHNASPFTRMETILLQAFSGMPQVKASGVKSNISDRVYELRSYESATEAQYLNKVDMFNSGEVTLFERLGFNAVFYGKVLAGGRMPNLMYMTSFANRADRDEHWKAFGSDPEWKKMSSMPKYQNNVSKIDITFLRPTGYSKL
jgi:hypothetical protein